MNGQIYLYEIRKYLAWFASQLKLENKSGNFDINKYAEGFLIPIVNAVFNTQFKRLEWLKVNYPAIDVLSEEKEIGIQITAEKGFDKIRETLKKYITNGVYKSAQLYYIVLDEEYQTTKTDDEIALIIDEELSALVLQTKPKVVFKRAEHILNLGALLKKIEEQCDVAKLKEIRDFLSSQYGSVTTLPTFSDVLVPYELAFESQINPKASNLPYQFNNDFFGREAELERLNAFLGSEEKVISVVADGGYGKTRLCIEFFKLSKEKRVDAYVINERAFKTMQFSEEIRVDRGIVILLDDAHKRKDILNDVLDVVGRLSGVKVVLTIRTAMYEETISELSTHRRQIPSVSLGRLTYESTNALIKSQLPGIESDQVQKLAERSKGVPIVILTMCQVIREGRYFSEISEEENFIRFVREVKAQVIADISSKFYLDKLHINKTIELLCLFSPLQSTEAEIGLLSKINGISFEETSIILDHLEEFDFIQRRYDISIKPDPYSDILLLDAAPRIGPTLQNNDSKVFVDRIIRNLVQVEHSERLKFKLDDLIGDFINDISLNELNGVEDIAKLKTNLETIAHFAYKKPIVVSRSLEVVLRIAAGKREFWGVGDSLGPYKHIQDMIDLIVPIVTLNLHGARELEYGLNLVLKLVKARNDYGILHKAFRYRVYDFNEFRYSPQQVCERQLFLLSTIKNIVFKEALSDDDTALILNGTGTLLALEFSIEESFNKYTHSFTFGTAQVPFNEITATIRHETLELLVMVYNRIRPSSSAEAIYDRLIRILLFIVKQSKPNVQFDQAQEVSIVSTFLFELMSSEPSMTERTALNRHLRLYSRREIKPEYKQLHKELLKVTGSVTALVDRLEFLLSEEYFFAKEHLELKVGEIMSEYKEDRSFFTDVVTVARRVSGKSSHFFDFLSYLNLHHRTKAMALFDYVTVEQADLILTFKSLVSANYKDSDYFYSKIQFLWDLNTEEAHEAVIFLITYGRNRDLSLYRGKDLDFIEEVVMRRNMQAIWRLSVALPDFIVVDTSRTLSLIAKVIHLEKYRDAGMLIQNLFENKQVTAKYRQELLDFVFVHTLDVEITTHEYDKLYEFLDRDHGFETLFDYIKMKVQRQIDLQEYYRLDLSHSYRNSGKNEEDREMDFIRVLDWYVGIAKAVPRLQEMVVEFFLPHGAMTDSLRVKIEKFASDLDLPRLVRLGKALEVYHHKNENTIRLLVTIGNGIASRKGYRDEMLTEIFSDLHNPGSKSKSGPGPFPQDIERRDLLQIVLETKMHSSVRDHIIRSLKLVQAEIDLYPNNEFGDKW